MLLKNRYQELLTKCDHNQVKVYASIWDNYKDKFNFDKVWETENEWNGKGRKHLSEGKFSELSDEAKKYFQPCIKEGEEVSFDKFVLDVLIHMDLDRTFANNPMKGFGFNF